MKNSKNKIITALTVAFLSSLPVYASEKIDGHWEGSINVMGNDLPIFVDITSVNDKINAKIDIPQQGAKNLELSNIEYKKPNIHLELATPSGNAKLNGKVNENKITGDFEQNGYKGTFNLEKKTAIQGEKPPYREEEVSFKNGDVTIAGTLTLPQNKGNYPAIVMITGSGPQNRDEDIFGFPIFKVIADHLTRKGIAVLRCDDRGIGGSNGGNILNATTADYATDTNASVNFLLNHPEINKNKIGLFGHSEGGIIAPMVAQTNKNVAFMILMSGTSESGEQIIKEQSVLISKANGISDSEIKANLNLSDRVFKVIKTDKGWEDLEREFTQQITDNFYKLPQEKIKAVKNKDQYIQASLKQMMATYKSSWFKYFITYDPLPVLKKTTVPTLALFGGKDLQVPSVTNAPLMERAFKQGGNRNYIIKVFPNANHLFQEAKTGSPSEYSTLAKGFVAGFLDTTSDWILNTTK